MNILYLPAIFYFHINAHSFWNITVWSFKFYAHYIYTWARDLSAMTTWNLRCKYSPLAAMLICPVITIFYIIFFSAITTWKWAKSNDFSSTVKLVAILSKTTLSEKPLGTMSKIDGLFLVYTTIPSQRHLRNHYIKSAAKMTSPEPKNGNFASAVKLAAILYVWHHYWEPPW